MASVPLSLIFILQSLMIFGSFAVVIWLLTEQQQSDLTTTIFDNIVQRQRATDKEVADPIRDFETPIRRLAEKIEAFPTLQCNSDSTFTTATPFFNEVFQSVSQDPLIARIGQFYEERTEFNVGDLPVWGGCLLGTNDCRVSAKGNEELQTFLEVNGTLDSSFPMNFSGSTLKTGSNYFYETTIGLQNSTEPNFTPGVLYPISLTEVAVFLTFNYPITRKLSIDGSRTITTWGLQVDLQMVSIGDIATAAKIADGSRVMLYEMNEETLLATSISTIPITNLVDGVATQWGMLSTPSTEMNAILGDALGKCGTGCDEYTYKTDSDVVSMKRITSTSGINMLLLQATPEEYFFGASRKTRLNGILVGAGAAVLVVISCIVIWLSIHRPLRTLQDNMDLAANMQNDKAEGNSCFLYEISNLNESFEKMNNKLLQARAFMPQSLLCAVGGEQEEDEDDDDIDEGGLEDEGPNAREEDEGSVAMSTGDHSQSIQSGSGSMYGHAPNNAKSTRKIDRKKRSKKQEREEKSENSSLRSGTTNRAKRYVLSLTKTLTNRRVGILQVNVRDFHRISQEQQAGQLVTVHQALVETVEASARAEKGVVDAFQGDHFVVTFNAALAVGAPAKGAALCALRIQNNLRARTAFSHVSMGVSSGLAVVGTLGSADIKKFCTISPSFTQATVLEQAAKRVPTNIGSCLFSQKICGDLDMHVYYQLVGQMMLPATNINNLTAFANKLVGVAVVMGQITTQGDEWLYELEEGASKNPYNKINAAHEMVFAGEKAKALELLSQGNEGTDKALAHNWNRLKKILEKGDEKGHILN